MNASFTPWHLSRPDRKLLTYYLITAALIPCLFPIVILPLYFKYHTLRYQFDEQGIRMSYGLLFRREVFLTYARIQDIHLTSDLIQRWLGLASVGVQTASGSATPEMTIVGLMEFAEIRDFLYRRMRGVKDAAEVQPPQSATPAAAADDVATLLGGIRDDLRAAARSLAERRP